MKSKLKDVRWNRRYPKEIENGEIRLEQRTWGRRLIYEVFVCETGESLGNCQVFEKERCNKKGHEACKACVFMKAMYVVREHVAKSPELEKRLPTIQNLIRMSI